MATQQLDRIPDLWGLGWFTGKDGDLVPFPASMPEMAAAQQVAAAHLRAFGVRPDDIVVFVARSRDAVQYAPWEEASNALGAAFCVVDGFRTDAHRLAAYVELFAPRAVLGVVGAVVEGLVGLGRDPKEVLGSVPVVTARPQAHRLLAELGQPSLRWNHLGPALAIQCPQAAELHVQAGWHPTADDGRIVLHPHGMAVGAEPIDTGWVGSVLDEQCRCGVPGPLLTVDGAAVGELPAD